MTFPVCPLRHVPAAYLVRSAPIRPDPQTGAQERALLRAGHLLGHPWVTHGPLHAHPTSRRRALSLTTSTVAYVPPRKYCAMPPGNQHGHAVSQSEQNQQLERPRVTWHRTS